MEIPKLNFSKWHAWEERNNIDGIDYPGIYAIAIKGINLAGKSLDYNDVIYIGMTNSQGGIKSRLKQFDNSIRGNPGHSGGRSVYYGNNYCEGLGEYNQDWGNNRIKPFVAIMPIECDTVNRTPNDLRKMGIVACLEYIAFARYKEVTGDEKPKYNTQ